MMLGRYRGQFVWRHGLPHEGGWPGWNGLRGCWLLAGSAVLRDRNFVDIEQRLASLAVQHVHKALLAGLYHGRDRVAFTPDIAEHRLGAQVVVPNVVVGGLEVPDVFPGNGIQCQHAVGVQVVSGAIGPVVVIGRRIGRYEQ